MLKLSEFMRTNEILAVPYRGKVVDNADPRRLGRVKVHIDGLLEGDIAALPWVYQESKSMLGGRNDLSSFAVPEVNSEIKVEFPYNDIYAGFYSGYWQSETTHQGYLDEDYPHCYGFRDQQNTHLRINKAKKIMEFQHASGARFFVDFDSTIEMTSGKEIKLKSIDGKTEFSFDMVTGDLKLNPKSSLEIGGNKTKFTGKEIVHEVGTVDEKIKGFKTTEVAGGHKLVVGGSSSESIVGNKAKSVAGDYSKLVAGETEEISGMGISRTVVTGGITEEVIQGGYEMSVLLGDYTVDLVAGKIKLANLLGKLEISIAGAVELSNLLASLKMDPAGGVTMDATLAMKISSLLTAEFSGLVQTKVGSGAGITNVLGSIVTLGGAGGMPVARLGDVCVGVGNLSIPVVSTIISGSFKVLSS